MTSQSFSHIQSQYMFFFSDKMFFFNNIFLRFHVNIIPRILIIHSIIASISNPLTKTLVPNHPDKQFLPLCLFTRHLSHLPKLSTDPRFSPLFLTIQKSNHPTFDNNPVNGSLIHSPNSRHHPHHQISYLSAQFSGIDPITGSLIYSSNLPGNDPLTGTLIHPPPNFSSTDLFTGSLIHPPLFLGTDPLSSAPFPRH